MYFTARFVCSILSHGTFSSPCQHAISIVLWSINLFSVYRLGHWSSAHLLCSVTYHWQVLTVNRCLYVPNFSWTSAFLCFPLAVCQMLLSCWQQVRMSFKIRWFHSFEISDLLSRLDNPSFFSIPFPLFWSSYSWTSVAMRWVYSKFLANKWTDIYQL